MRVGDLVKRKVGTERRQAGLITSFVDKKCWRTHIDGPKINWDKIEPEPHAIVLFGDNYVTIPLIDLQLVNAD